MSFPRYPKYKASGVEWLGEVPEHWRVLSLGRITVDRCDGPFGSGLKSEHYTDSGVRVIRLQNIRSDAFNGDDAAHIDAGYYWSELNGHGVVRGDVLIAGLGDDNNTVGRACVAPAGIEPAMVKADCFRFRLDVSQTVPAFVATQLSAGAAADAGVLSSGSTRSRIPLSVTSTRKVALPPRDEQATIASFLDRETSKIDGLVGEQRRLIELLKEKRQAVISHAVTKGLNPHAPLKPSGIEWLGNVPEHWEVKKVKHLSSRISSGKTPLGGSEVYVDEGITFVRSQNVYDEGLRLDDVVFISAAVDESMAVSRVIPNDILLNITGASIGRSCVVPIDFPSANVNQHVCVIRLKKTAHVPFVGWVFKSATIKSQIDHAQNGAAREGLNFVQIGEMPISLPPDTEQERIASFLDHETAKLDALTTEAERGIKLLQERRTALISAAVTGKIDVRGLAETEAA